MDSIEGKKLVVVGGSRGLGLAVVEAAVAKKAIVTVIARTTADLEALRVAGHDLVQALLPERLIIRLAAALHLPTLVHLHFPTLPAPGQTIRR